MGTRLTWSLPPKGTSLPSELANSILQGCRFGVSVVGFPVVVTTKDLSYFEGLRDAGIEGAQELVNLICAYKEINLNIEC